MTDLSTTASPRFYVAHMQKTAGTTLRDRLRVLEALQTHLALQPRDAGAWQRSARLWELQGLPLRAMRAQAEVHAARGDLRGAIDRLRAGLRQARGLKGADQIALALMEDAESEVRSTAAYEVQNMNDEDRAVFKPLLKKLAESDPSGEVRTSAIDAFQSVFTKEETLAFYNHLMQNEPTEGSCVAWSTASSTKATPSTRPSSRRSALASSPASLTRPGTALSTTRAEG